MREMFPIRQGRETRFIPFDVLKPHAAYAPRVIGFSLTNALTAGGLTAAEAVAIIEHLDEQPLEIAATLMLKEHVERFYQNEGRTVTPVVSAQPVIPATIQKLERGVALAKAMRHRVNGETTLYANYSELIDIMENARIALAAYGARKC